MGVTAIFGCGGCEAKAEGKRLMTRDFISITGKSHGIGGFRYDDPRDVVPDGWIAFDLIGATYCPKCAADLGLTP